MTKDDFVNLYSKNTFSPSLRRIFSIFPLGSLAREWIFILAVVLSLAFSLVIYVFTPNKLIAYIAKIIGITYAILPAVLGISLAGFAIVVSQINTDTLSRVANIPEGKPYSLYQKTNASFSITALSQLLALFISVIVDLLTPLVSKIVVIEWLADITNAIVFMLLLWLFMYSMLSVFDTIKTIFTSGQVANFLYVKSKIEADATLLTENKENVGRKKQRRQKTSC